MHTLELLCSNSLFQQEIFDDSGLFQFSPRSVLPTLLLLLLIRCPYVYVCMFVFIYLYIFTFLVLCFLLDFFHVRVNIHLNSVKIISITTTTTIMITIIIILFILPFFFSYYSSSSSSFFPSTYIYKYELATLAQCMMIQNMKTSYLALPYFTLFFFTFFLVDCCLLPFLCC